jgi:hypothetical protein
MKTKTLFLQHWLYVTNQLTAQTSRAKTSKALFSAHAKQKADHKILRKSLLDLEILSAFILDGKSQSLLKNKMEKPKIETVKGVTNVYGSGIVLPGISTGAFDEICTKGFLKPARLSRRPSKIWRSLGLSFVHSMFMTNNGNVTFGESII